jgi:hypothetical protein
MSGTQISGDSAKNSPKDVRVLSKRWNENKKKERLTRTPINMNALMDSR